MLSVDEALAIVEKHAAPLTPRRLPLDVCAGLVLAEDIVSKFNSPPYDKTMMDGYAVVSSDTTPVRRVLEEIGAGTVPSHAVTHGTATRLMTGAPMPAGADAVVPVEKADPLADGTVRLQQFPARAGQHVLKLGSSLRAGQVVLKLGALIRPIEIAILAEIGHAEVKVQPRPRVAILTTGNELVSIGETPGPGQIRNSNGPMLAAAVTRAGGEPQPIDNARDELADLRCKIQQGLEADVLLLSGGVSAGDFDLVPGVLAELGVEPMFHKIALRPGKPLWFGVKDHGDRRTYVFGLPGNPVSSFVCFELFARPMISKLSGRGFTDPSAVSARLCHAYEHGGGRAACLPARIILPNAAQSPSADAAVTSVEILSWLGSADMAALARANGLVRLPAENVLLPAGTMVDVLLI